MATLTKILLLLGLVIFIGSCSTYRNVYFNYDQSVDFTQYSTFAWAPDTNIKLEKDIDDHYYDNDLVRNNAKNYITHNLTQRGYIVNVDSPDLVLELVLLNEKKERIITYHNYPYSGYYFYHPYYFPYYYPYYRLYTWYGPWYPPFWDHTAQFKQTYLKGTVTINMYDRRLNKLVFTGSAEGDIYDPAYIQYDVHPAIDRILRNFPVKPFERQKQINDSFKDIMARSNSIHREFKGISKANR